MINIRVLLLTFATIAFAATAHADDCKLTQVASLDMTMTDDGRILVPVTLDGVSKFMLVDTGAPASSLGPDTVSELKLKTETLSEHTMYDSQGLPITALALVSSVLVDKLHASNLKFLVGAKPYDEPNMAGVLGADTLRNYELDLDFPNHKLNLLSQDHCPGKVIYWPATTIAVVPFKITQSSHIVLDVQLDDKPVRAIFDTGAGNSVLDLTVATEQFDLKPDTPDMTSVGNYGGDRDIPVYMHTFKTITLDGITLKNPKVEIFEDMAATKIRNDPEIGTRIGSASENNGVTPMVLGIRQLNHLHLFISYKERTLYITPPSPPPGAETSSATPH